MGKRILGILLGISGLLGVVYAALALTAEPALSYPFFDREGVLVIAHQGGNQLRPDNTMIAFNHAAALGVDVLEMDIHSTADGHLVVIHDDTVDRTTDGRGPVNDFTLAELQTLDAAHRWTPDDGETYPYRGQGITIPTLEEVFAAFPEMPMVIEMKQMDPPIARSLCRLIEAYERRSRVLIASFHEEAMTDFRERCPGVATSMVEPEIRLFYGLNRVGLAELFEPPGQAFQVPEYSGDLHVVTPEFVAGAHERNVDVHVWTVNETADMERMLAAGVDGIITDRPDRLLALLGRRE